MTAYEVITRNSHSSSLDDEKFNALIEEFASNFLAEKNYAHRLEIHRSPVELKNELLHEIFSYITRLQWRQELSHIENINEKTSQGYVNSKVKEIWESDKRISSMFQAIQQYCHTYSKDINTIGVHLAEFEATNQLAHRIQQSIHPTTISSSLSKVDSGGIKKKRASISRIKLSRLLKEVNGKCPFCNYNDPAHLKVHHIDEDWSHSDPDRLILVCGICHDKIHAGEISRSEVMKLKTAILSVQQLTPHHNSSIAVNSTTTNIRTGNNTTIKITAKKRIFEKYPPGCIGYEVEKRNYIGYLIDQYHIFKVYDTGKEKMNYAIFPSHLKKIFKTGQSGSIYNLSVGRFEELYHYIQKRINSTTLGNIRGAAHHKFDSFEEYTKGKRK